MKYVKLQAKNYNEALMQLREKYGEDAIPISHKYVKEGGVFNTALFAKEVVELTAAIHEPKRELKRPLKRSSFDTRIDNDVSDMFSRPKTPDNGAAYQGTFRKNFNFESRMTQAELQKEEAISAEGNVQDTLYTQKGTYSNMQKPAEAVQKPAEEKASDDQVELSADRYNELKKFEKEFYEIKESLQRLADAQKIEQENRDAVATDFRKEKNEHLRSFADILRNNDYTEEECSSVISEVKDSMPQADLADSYKIEKSLREVVRSAIVTTGPVKFDGRKKVIMFVGPTGVGKTTSLAKLGAHLSLRENKKVCFITIDTYRIAATEQLKKYAEIMRIPIHVVSDTKQFKSVIDKEEADVVLVDTSGRSHRNTMKISEIKNYAEQVNYDLEKYLCVSATTKRNDLSSIFNSFETLQCNSVLITKVDETSFVGNVVKVADTYNKPISYISDGQEVPNNLRAATAETLTDLIIGGSQAAME